MKPAPFEYIRASSVEEAVSALADWNGEARLLAGGQSLMPLLNARLAQPAALVDINGIQALDSIREDNGAVVVGALVRHSALEWSSVVEMRVPLLAEAVRFVGDRQIRTRGTIGGSVAHADPTGELPLGALLLAATIRARSRDGSREIAASEFFQGLYATALESGEMVTELIFPRVEGAVSAFAEHARRHGDFAILSVAAMGVPGSGQGWKSLRLALGGVADRPLLVERASSIAAGTRLEPDVVRALGEASVEASDPRSDVRASAEYRRHLIPVYVERVLAELEARRARARR
jgi:aerobic carbon-monoxide dehydrogenase medium subunit